MLVTRIFFCFHQATRIFLNFIYASEVTTRIINKYSRAALAIVVANNETSKTI